MDLYVYVDLWETALLKRTMHALTYSLACASKIALAIENLLLNKAWMPFRISSSIPKAKPRSVFFPMSPNK